jgi:hypothetical protein
VIRQQLVADSVVKSVQFKQFVLTVRRVIAYCVLTHVPPPE